MDSILIIFVINLTLLQATHLVQQRTQILSKHTQVLQFFILSTKRTRCGPKNSTYPKQGLDILL